MKRFEIDSDNSIFKFVAWGVLLALFIFLTLNKNSKSSFEESNYQYEAWADKGGYYIYLPWMVNTGFDASQFDNDLPGRLGNGFSLDGKKVRSKYSIGIAILQLPFYCLAEINAQILYEHPTGFEKVYMNWMGVGSAFYLWVGLIVAFRTIRKLTSLVYTILSIVCITLGTNLFYYAFDETLMTHVYSFFLITIFCHLILERKQTNLYQLFFWGAGIVILRPTNIFFILLLTFLFREKINLNVRNIKRNDLIYLSGAIILVVLQVTYWKYAFDAYYPKGYANETFSNYLSPKILKVLFAPNNGWFPYAVPILLGFVLSFFISAKDKLVKRVYILGYLLVIVYTYLIASWWTYDFGCGLGSRNFVDFSFVWMLLLALVYYSIRHKKLLTFGLMGLNLFLIIINLMVSYHYDNCWFGTDWDWESYLNLIH